MFNMHNNNMLVQIISDTILKLIAKSICHNKSSLFASIIDVVTWSKIKKIVKKNVVYDAKFCSTVQYQAP